MYIWQTSAKVSAAAILYSQCTSEPTFLMFCLANSVQAFRTPTQRARSCTSLAASR